MMALMTATQRRSVQVSLCLALIAVIGLLQLGPVRHQVLVLHHDLVQPLVSGFTRTALDPGQAKDVLGAGTSEILSYTMENCATQLESEDRPTLGVSVTLVVYAAPGADIRRTLISVLKNLAWTVDIDVIVMVDGDEPREAVLKARTEVNGVKGVKVEQAESRGRVAAQAEGAAVAVGSVLVFLDAGVMLSKGWLEELVSTVLKKPSAFVLPHLDDLDGTYLPVDETRVVAFNQAESTVKLQAAKLVENMAPSPGLIGLVFAVKRSYLSALGGFLIDLRETSHLELALRAWNCQGGVYVTSCSRVAVPSVQIPIRAQQWLRVKAIWLPQYAQQYPEALGKGQTVRDEIASYAGTCDVPRADLEATIQGFNVTTKPTLEPPIVNDRIIGQGTCIYVEGNRLLVSFLADCNFWENYLFSYKDGVLKNGDKCVEAKNMWVVEVQDCVAGKKQQQWGFAKDKAIEGSFGTCFQHVTHPRDGAQAIMTQWCNSNGHQQFDFESRM